MQKKKFAGSYPKVLLLGTVIIIITYLALTAIIGIICYNSADPTKNIELYSMLALVASGGIGTFIGAKLLRDSGFIPALFPAVITLALYIILSMILSGGTLSLSHGMNILCFCLLSALAAFLGTARSDKKRHHRR